MIKSVAKVIVHVDDQERAREFWTGPAGFELARDETYGDERWIEVAPPGGGPVLVLSPRPAEQPRPDVSDMLPHSPVFFTCDDIHRTYAEMRERGVEFQAAPVQMHFGWWAMFTDPDGTRYALGQWPGG
jgi:predicted enzyme related to lactoylglutathione lyase